MDAMKKATAVDYTSWDLNCPQYVHVRNRQKWEAKFKRKGDKKMKKTYTAMALILLAFMIGSVFGILLGRETAETPKLYSMGGVIVETSYANDMVTFRDFNGNLWQFQGVEDFSVNDCVSVIMDSKKTPEIRDDEIISVRYDGWLAGWSE